VRVIAFTHPGRDGSGPLYQLSACLLAPSADAHGPGESDADPGESDVDPGESDVDPGESDADPGERDLIYLTGTCTMDQAPLWDRAFVDAASSVRFG